MFGIGYVNKKVEPCTKDLLYEAINSKSVADTCALIKRMVNKMEQSTDLKSRKWCEMRIAQAKKTLPVITPLAYFKDNRRCVGNAIQSGLNMLDIDHVDDPRGLWENIKGKCTAEVLVVHVTPSTRGLRIIFRQPDKSIEEAQADLARELGVTYDGVTKDLARCSFLVPRDYFIVLEEEKLFGAPLPRPLPQMGGEVANGATLPQSVPQMGAPLPRPLPQMGAPLPRPLPQMGGETDVPLPQSVPQMGGETVSFPSAFKNIPYSDIIELLLTHAGYDVTPTEGERNNALYMLARNLRYVCDFDTQFIISVLPDWGLAPAEIKSTVESAIKSVRMATMPNVLTQIIQNAQRRAEIQNAEMFRTAFDYNVSEEGLIGEFVKNQPTYLKNAAYLTAMTCFGTLLTRLRGYGPDGRVLAPNFMLTVSAPQATGKSFMKRIMNQILEPIKEEDETQRKKMAEIEKENRRNRDKEDYEEKEFEGVIRLLPTNTSNRVLLERMDKAKGQHLMIFAEEIDSITKSEKSGKWSEKSDIYRLAYDNSEWGQDYASENSYHAVVPLYLNLMFSGTPAAVSRFFNDIENGLITRFMFCNLPDTFGQKRPKIGIMDEDTRKRISEKVHTLYKRMQNVGTEDGLHWMDTTKMCEDADEYYDEVQRRMYLCNQDDVCRDLARRRYCNYVVTMMMVETYLNDGVYTESIRDRVIAVVNLITEQLIANYGDEINKSLNDSVERQQVSKARSKRFDVLEQLPDRFTSQEYREALVECGGASTSCGTYLKRLVAGGVVKLVEYGIYEKVV